MELTTKTERAIVGVDGSLKAGAAGSIDAARKGDSPAEGAVKNAVDKAVGVPVSKAYDKAVEHLDSTTEENIEN